MAGSIRIRLLIAAAASVVAALAIAGIGITYLFDDMSSGGSTPS